MDDKSKALFLIFDSSPPSSSSVILSLVSADGKIIVSILGTLCLVGLVVGAGVYIYKRRSSQTIQQQGTGTEHWGSSDHFCLFITVIRQMLVLPDYDTLGLS